MVMFHWHQHSINISPSRCCLCWCAHSQECCSLQLAHTVPVTCWGKLSPWVCLHPWMFVLRLLLVGWWLYKPWQVQLPSQNCCTHSSGSLDLWVCMHALRPINENKVITVCGWGSCRGSVWPQPEVLPTTGKCVHGTSWAPKLCFVTCSKDTQKECSPLSPVLTCPRGRWACHD